MKIRTIKLASFTFLFLLSSGSYSASTAAPTSILIPTSPSGFEVTLGALYLQPSAGNLGWSVTTTVLPIPTPQWHVNVIEPSYQPGFTLGARYIFPNTEADLQLNWLHLNTSDTDNVSVDPASQWVSPFSQTGTPPTGGEITGVASLKRAQGEVKFNYDVVNLDAGKFIDLGSMFQVRLFSGLSGVHLRESLTSSFTGLPKVAFTLDNTTTFNGIGPRLGISNFVHIYDGFSLLWQFAGSFLIGSTDPAQYQFSGTGSDLALIGITTNNESVSSSSVKQVVPGVDTKLGLKYLIRMHQNSMFTLELGWMGALYLNPFSGYETNTNVIALDSGSLSTSSVKHVQSNFSATGVYLTASLTV